jgi:hypothetical protein
VKISFWHVLGWKLTVTTVSNTTVISTGHVLRVGFADNLQESFAVWKLVHTVYILTHARINCNLASMINPASSIWIDPMIDADWRFYHLFFAFRCQYTWHMVLSPLPKTWPRNLRREHSENFCQWALVLEILKGKLENRLQVQFLFVRQILIRKTETYGSSRTQVCEGGCSRLSNQNKPFSLIFTLSIGQSSTGMDNADRSWKLWSRFWRQLCSAARYALWNGEWVNIQTVEVPLNNTKKNKEYLDYPEYLQCRKSRRHT